MPTLLPRLTPSAFTVTEIRLPEAKYFSGRQCRVCLSSQKNFPSTGGEVSTTTAFSAAARSFTERLKWMIGNCPTPYVPPFFNALSALAWKVTPAVLPGLSVVKVLVCCAVVPDGSASTAVIVYVCP